MGKSVGGSGATVSYPVILSYLKSGLGTLLNILIYLCVSFKLLIFIY